MHDPLDDDRLTLAGLLIESSVGLRAQLGRRLEDECGLSLQWFDLLIRLARSPDHRLRMAELAAQTVLTPSGLTRAVDRLEEVRLIERTACPSDRRGAFAVLTDEGLRRVRTAVPVHLVHLEEHLTGVLSESERSQLKELLRKIRDHVNPEARPSGELTRCPQP
ncbi:MAG: MarR family winged helix-turn-helix transcriptional regulator [Actinobacteria bacterium]|nr:MarR family winged helix-turn-helix transcriptional regulator [Actinomycetota bacterium]